MRGPRFVGSVLREGKVAVAGVLERELGLERVGESDWLGRFEGPLRSGRLASFDCVRGLKDGPRFLARLQVTADRAPRLHITREDFWTKIQKALGLKQEVVIGDPAFDGRYLLETKEPLRSTRALTTELKEHVNALFAFRGALELSFERGSLTALFDAGMLRLGAVRDVYDRLDRMARLFDRKSIFVSVLGGERLALVDQGGKTRCPYCHGAIAGDEEALVACESCRTVLHEGCWSEHGRCPILGCSGRKFEGRRRAGESP
jgi:hypothetical protein